MKSDATTIWASMQVILCFESSLLRICLHPVCMSSTSRKIGKPWSESSMLFLSRLDVWPSTHHLAWSLVLLKTRSKCRDILLNPVIVCLVEEIFEVKIEGEGTIEEVLQFVADSCRRCVQISHPPHGWCTRELRSRGLCGVGATGLHDSKWMLMPKLFFFGWTQEGMLWE